MTDKEFFDWLRTMQDDKKLSQNEVDVANELLKTMSAEDLKQWLIEINDWQEQGMNVNQGKMTLSAEGTNLIKQFEAYRAKPYQDSKGVWTIGYGNTYYPDGRKVTAKDAPISEPQAAELKQYVTNRDFVPAVNLMLRNEIAQGKVTQNMFDALVSLAYNIGTGALAKSSVIKHLKNGDKQAAADAFLAYKFSGGKFIQGLLNRRHKERKLFLA